MSETSNPQNDQGNSTPPKKQRWVLVLLLSLVALGMYAGLYYKVAVYGP